MAPPFIPPPYPQENISLLFSPPPYSPSHWSWEHLFSPSSFYWAPAFTPFSDIHLVTYSIIAYLIVLPLLQLWMKNRPAYSLSGLIRIHNLILCVWSLAMCVGAIIGVVELYQIHGLWSLFCGPSKDEYVMHGFLYYWAYWYYLSKYYELLDTIKKLIFLHVFHHASMIFVSWAWLYSNWALVWWGVFSNTLVHVFMYYYYFVATLGYSPWWKKYITSGQIVQFLVGIGMTCLYLYLKIAYADVCGGDLRIAYFSQFMFFAFLFLFINFYVQTYKQARRSAKKEE